LLTLAMLAVLVGLGVWQIERLAWKRGVLEQISLAEARPAVALPEHPEPYTKVAVRGRFRSDLAVVYGSEVRDVPGGSRIGAHLIVPVERADGPYVLVDRGWVPEERDHPIATPEGEVTVDGYVRPAAVSGLFSAADDAAGRRFYTLNPAAIGTALGLARVAPFTVVALGPDVPGVFPDPARLLPRPPNDHLSYALTWFGLAGVLLVVFGLWARKVLA